MILGSFVFFIPAGAQSSGTNDYYPELEGITMYAIGDSYFGGSSLGKNGTWVNKLGDKYGMDYENYSIDGSTVANYVTTRNPMVDRIYNMNKGDANIILLEGGRNDLGQKVPLGGYESRDTKTFYGAVNFMLDYLLDAYPNALIVLVTPWRHSGKNSSGHTNLTYANAMRNIAKDRKDPRIVCLYAADTTLTGVNMDNEEFRAQYCLSPTDPSHLNERGMELVLPKMEKFIAEAYINYLNSTKIEGTTAETTTEPVADTSATVTEPQTETEPAVESGCGALSSITALTAIICGACLTLFYKRRTK